MNNSIRFIKQLNWTNLISSKWIMALIPTLVIVLLLPDLLQKYNCELKSKINRENSGILDYFEDIDNDGTPEIFSILNFYGFAACLVRDHNGSIIRQVNFQGLLPKTLNKIPFLLFNDIDHDGNKEIFLFTQIADSLFLNAFDYHTTRILLDKRFICTIGLNNNKTDFDLYPVINYDMNGDGINEIYFNIHAGYALAPRQLFCYDYPNDSLITSPQSGIKLVCEPHIDSNGDLSIYGLGNSTDNCKANFPYAYSDTCAWFFVFNKKLKPKFAPLPFGTIATSLSGKYINPNEFHLIQMNSNSENQLHIIDTLGNFSTLQLSERGSFTRFNTLKRNKTKHYLLGNFCNDITHIVEYFPQKRTFKPSKLCKHFPYSDYDQVRLKNIEETVLMGYNPIKAQVELITSDLKHKIDLPKNSNLNTYINYIQTEPVKNGDLLYLNASKFLQVYLLSKNQYYPFRYLAFLVIYLLNVLFVQLIQSIQKRQLSKRENLQKEIEALQLQLVNAQLDPHFTFNSINTVSSKILKGEKLEAYDLMTTFSRMMRSAMLFSNKTNWSLKEELQFTKDYLTLMQQRFPNRFEFTSELDISIALEKINLPRLLIQNFAENAVKHAFNGIDYMGKIELQVKRENDKLVVTISDNGIGREQAMENFEKSKNKSGKGLGLIRKQVEIFNKLHGTKIKIEISDLNPEKANSGTRITISGFE